MRSSYGASAVRRACTTATCESAEVSSIAQRVDSGACAFEQSGCVRQPFVLGRNFFPLTRLWRKHVELVDDPAQSLLFGHCAGRHRFSFFACSLCAFPRGERVRDGASRHCEPTVLIEQLQL